MKRAIVVLLTVLALTAWAEDQATLTKSSSIPVPDGVVGPNEYQFNKTDSGMTVGATLGSDGMVYLAVQAKTTGWVALGVGGYKMDGSRLFLAYDTGKKRVFNEQIGKGHFHSDVKDPVVSKWAVKQADGVTTLELVLPEGAAVKDGSIDILYAYSNSTIYMIPHKAKGVVSLKVSE
jgi:hypothetical protein